MQKKSYYIEEEQLRKLELLSSVCPGQPKVSSLIREGIDLLLDKYLEVEFLKQALAKKQKRTAPLKRIRPV